MLYSFQCKALNYWKAYMPAEHDRALCYRFCKRKKNNLKSRFKKQPKTKPNLVRLIIRTWITYLGYRNRMKSLILQMLRDVCHRICHNHTSSIKHVFYCLESNPKTQQIIVIETVAFNICLYAADSSTLQIQTLSTLWCTVRSSCN